MFDPKHSRGFAISEEARNWLYAMFQVSITGVILWAHYRHQLWLIETRWPADLQRDVLKHAAESDLYAWICTGLVVVGLVTRNLVRNWNFKLDRTGASASMNAQGDNQE